MGIFEDTLRSVQLDKFQDEVLTLFNEMARDIDGKTDEEVLLLKNKFFDIARNYDGSLKEVFIFDAVASIITLKGEIKILEGKNELLKCQLMHINDMLKRDSLFVNDMWEKYVKDK
jgi:hypothetical protein